METTISNFVVRPITPEDIDGLQQIAGSLRGSLTTLPKDRAFLERRITSSLRAFDPLVRSAGGDFYLFVLEDVETGNLVGTSGILARIGGFEPFYSYKIKNELIRHDSLGVAHEIAVLHLDRSHTGPSEVCSLLLRPDYRRKHLGRLLSLTRFLFMAAYGERFESTVIAEVRGVVDDEGKSPFWEAVARPFFRQDFQTADLWSGMGNKQFIEDLMPKYPIYVPLLPQAAQDVIGEVHPRARAAAVILQAEGFMRTRQVDIFDAGPLLQAPRKGIRTVNESRRAKISGTHEPSSEIHPQHIIARPDLNFRCCLASIRESDDGTVTVPPHVLDLLKVSAGETILFAPFQRKVPNQ